MPCRGKETAPCEARPHNSPSATRCRPAEPRYHKAQVGKYSAEMRHYWAYEHSPTAQTPRNAQNIRLKHHSHYFGSVETATAITEGQTLRIERGGVTFVPGEHNDQKVMLIRFRFN